MNPRTLMTAMTAAALAAGCAAREQAADPAADAAAAMKADRDFSAATVERRLEGFRSFLAADARTIRPNRPIIAGGDSVAALWAPLLQDSSLAIRWEPEHGEATGPGAAFTVGRYEILQRDTVVATGRYVTIWRRQADGQWRVVFDSGVPDAPAGG